VVSNAPDDAELERLLIQLLRVMRPAASDGTADGAANGAPDRRAAGMRAGAGRAADGSAGDPGAGGAAADDVRSGDVSGDEAPSGDGVPSGAPADLPAVSASEARALIELVTARGIAQGELARLLGLEKSTVSRLAAGLERKGWIRRGRDSDNQRYVRLYLTPEGREVAARVWQAWQSRPARILAALSDDERAGLSSGLRGLVRGLAAEGLLGGRAD
jgi:DNA-binding MarR family transcriptional regulator